MIAADRVAVVLLAAGLSRRFGSADKLLAPFRGKPLAAHAAATLAATQFGSLIAVCGSDPVADLLGGHGFTIVRNDRPEDGQARSIRLGVAAAGDPDAILIALADMPFVTPAHLARLLAAFEPGAIVASRATRPMPPALFDRRHIPALLALEGDHGAKGLLDQSIIVEADSAILADIDTPPA